MQHVGQRDFVRLSAGANALDFDPSVGNLRNLMLCDQGRRIHPLHTAHWVGGVVPDDMAPVEKSLSGDFFCAPFGKGDDPDTPPHGWTANSPWQVASSEDAFSARLDRTIQGAHVTKTLTFAPDAPILLQEHVIEGGAGPLTFAHHPMVKLHGAGRLATSAKRAAITPETPVEPAQNLSYPARSTDLSAFPGAGGMVDLTRLPIAAQAEDFVTLVEGATPLGWTAILREAEGDIVFFLKNPSVMPVTMIWHSNAGRAFAPWNGRHTGVIGIEDGCAAGMATPMEANRPNPVSAEGVATCLHLSDTTRHRIAHVTGAIVCPEGWTDVVDICVDEDRLMLIGDTGATRTLPFPGNFLELET